MVTICALTPISLNTVDAVPIRLVVDESSEGSSVYVSRLYVQPNCVWSLLDQSHGDVVVLIK